MSPENEIAELANELRETNELLRERYNVGGGSASVKIGDSFRSGALVGVCITTCVATWIALIIGALVMTNLFAWKDVHNNAIGQLKADVAQLKERGTK